MAHSDSLRKGQIPINCQLCEADIRIKWKCLDCNLLICERCKNNFHLKFKNASQHKVVNIKEVGQNNEQSDFSKIECDEHPEQDCCLFCDTCGKSVCPICISKIHNGHELVEITKSNVKVPQNKKKQVKSDITIVKEFDTSLLGVECISILKDNSLWISSGVSEQLQNVKPEGDNLKVISEIDILVAKMAVTSSDNLLLVTKQSTALQQINNVNKTLVTNTNYSVAPLQPTCVHVTRDNKVIVGARGGDRPFPAKGRRVIIVMDTSGNHLTVFENNRLNHPLFTYVKSISTTQNGCVCVVDILSDDDRGRLLFLGQSGDVLNTYNGNSIIKRYEFRPSKVVTTPSDCFIVNDPPISALHILDNTGNLIKYYSTRQIGIISPFSLEFSNEGQLYIGCSEINNGKLYLVDIS